MNKQIEEMAIELGKESIICLENCEECSLSQEDCELIEYATILYNAGYTQKIKDDEVVISKDEYERLLVKVGFYKNLEINYNTVYGMYRQYEIENNQLKKYNDDLLKTAQELINTRKETAREILQELNRLANQHESYADRIIDIRASIENFAEKFGVEVE